MKQYDGFVIHFGEIWLKGRNRHSFIKILKENIIFSLKGEKYKRLDDMRDRFFISVGKDSNLDSISNKLSYIFGISWFAPVILSDNTLDAILKTTNKLLSKKDTVRIVPHRALKSLSFNSSDVVSYFIKNTKKLNFEIDKNSKRDLYINLTKDRAFIYTDKVKGANGLPVGSSGKMVVLFSGGIDSPVASFYAMKRGLKPIYMHVHAFPNNKDKNLSKINELAEILSMYSGSSKIFLIPGHVFQSAALKIPRKYELVLFKLFLYKLAEQIVKMEEADCIVSGESLGQVASQTIGNLTSSQEGIKPLIIRPLIGFDKQEIINVAKSIDTFETSIKQYKDVCSIAARNPATNSNPLTLKKLWKKGSMDSALKMTIKKMSEVKVNSA
jgi:tRNA uracil 4-sulfurtransferase